MAINMLVLICWKPCAKKSILPVWSKGHIFRRFFELGGESLSRPPRGFDKDHELIDDIKRTSFIAVRDLAVEDCLSPQFQRKVETSFAAATPFMRFLCQAVDVPF